MIGIHINLLNFFQYYRTCQEEVFNYGNRYGNYFNLTKKRPKPYFVLNKQINVPKLQFFLILF